MHASDTKPLLLVLAMIYGGEWRAKLVLKSWESGVRSCSDGDKLGEVDLPGAKTISPSPSLLKATAAILSFLGGIWGRDARIAIMYSTLGDFSNILAEFPPIITFQGFNAARPLVRLWT